MRRLFILLALPMAMAAFGQGPDYTPQENECLEIIGRYLSANRGEITQEDIAKLYPRHSFVFRHIEENLAAPDRRSEVSDLYNAMASGLVRRKSEVDYANDLASSVMRYAGRAWRENPEAAPVTNNILRNVMETDPDALTPEAEAVLRSVLEGLAEDHREPIYAGIGYEWVLLAGKVMGRDCLDYLARIVDRYWWQARKDEHFPVSGPLNTIKPRPNAVFASLLASARVYRSEDIQTCIDIVDRSSPSDILILNHTRNHLLYINRPEIVDYLAGFLDSIESRPALPHDPNGSKEYASMRAAGLLGLLLPELDTEAKALYETLQATVDQDDPNRDEAIVKAYIDFHKAWLADRSRWEPLLQRE